jgi:hypothetical protein
MLVNLLNLLREIMEERSGTRTQYCGWGTSADEAIRECLDAGIPVRLIQRLEKLAYYGYWFD